MSKFVTGKELEEVVYDILFEAKRQLLLVSPYIKLDTYFREILDRHARNPELEIIVVFGKNEGKVTRSVSRADLEYFTKFPNVTLIYAPSLHAKYYGNEVKGVVTSINLYDYSFRNNIEFGVYSENAPIMEKLLEAVNRKSLEDQSFEQAMRVASSHDVVFAKRPIYKQRGGLMSKIVGSAMAKDCLGAEIVFDAVDELLSNRPYPSKRLADIPKELEYQQMVPQVRPSRQEVEAKPAPLPSNPAIAHGSHPDQKAAPLQPTVPVQAHLQPDPASAKPEEVHQHLRDYIVSQKQVAAPTSITTAPQPVPTAVAQDAQPRTLPVTPVASPAPQASRSAYPARARSTEQGFCIRTGTPIPFNLERPFSYPAYKSWARFSNDDYPERYCHKTGKESNGKTSKRNPILASA
ncbi:hypothetical protein HER32_16755 [Hymenobacter sp. BT18]|uniref:phospholipase D family protein n=1 Tax=Hymenobacter sp. BT18 TaxID=2835648 RepID=UPI00143E79BE|nr:phospholipase D family protein [Hymenobacter sp. BT18]QIX62733.1 hypothetical protein HER32_16755 [Hymenobacter sp. BT18]